MNITLNSYALLRTGALTYPIVAGNLRLLIENIQKVCLLHSDRLPLFNRGEGPDADFETVRRAHLHKVP